LITIRYDPISTQPQSKKQKTRNRTFRRLSVYGFKKVITLTVVALTLSFFSVEQAHAGLFSFIGSLLGIGGTFSAVDAGQNLNVSLQTMPLLESPRNPDIKKAVTATGGAILPIIENTTLLPVVGPLGSIADVEEIKTDIITLYTVREGDNISVIARMFGVTTNTIIWANDIKRGNIIQPGDVLVILPVTGIRHAVEKGDTLQSIAKEYKGNLEEILMYNELAADAVLSVGDEVIIPDGEVTAQAVAAAGTSQLRINVGSLKDAVGYYVRPVGGGKKSQGLHGFNGVDLAASCGAPIYASAAGTVIVSKAYGWNGGYGNYIVISHANGTQTLYSHNTANWVSSGQYVAQGQTIGTIGSTGRSTGCHVHFEVRGAKNPF
jgi:LysM repeat protein